MDRNSIQEEAKQIMDNFMAAMKDIDVEEDFVLERDICLREEGNGTEIDDDFRQRFLGNAAKISGDAVVANKGDWEK